VTDFVIAGLGNPGAEHAHDRHNAGAMALNRLAKRHHIDFKAGRTASTGKGRMGDSEVVLVKPRTWMNSSGKAIGPLLNREHVIVLYDELDLPEGRLRLRPKGGHGGHNGLKSIIEAVGSADFGRVRIGIGRPLHRGVPSWDPEVVMRHVLAQPPKDGREKLETAVERAAEAVEAIIERGWERAMDVYNRTDAGALTTGSQRSQEDA
jgi:peptidyl-tRNA hydrolase, PTH1 family